MSRRILALVSLTLFALPAIVERRNRNRPDEPMSEWQDKPAAMHPVRRCPHDDTRSPTVTPQPPPPGTARSAPVVPRRSPQ